LLQGEQFGVWIPMEARFSRMACRPTQSAIQWVLGKVSAAWSWPHTPG